MYLDDREGAALCPTTEEQEEFVESCFSDREKLINDLIARNKIVYTFRFIPLSALEYLGYPVTVIVDRVNTRFAFQKAKEEYFDRFDPEEPVIVFEKIDNHPLFKDSSLSYCTTLW